MKILILTQYFPPEFGAAASRNSEHALYWAQQGHSVEVCTGFPNYPSGVIPPDYQGRHYQREEKNGYTVHRSWIYATPNRSIISRALASVSFMVSAFLVCLLKTRRPDIIIASSGPFFVAPLGYLVSLFRGVPFVFEVRDILPQQAVDVGLLKNQWMIALLTWIEEFCYHRAARVVTVAEASRQALIKRGLPAEKVFTIENGIRDELFFPRERENEIRREYGWEGKFVAMYIGAHGISQGLMTLLLAAQRLEEEAPDVLFVFVGDGAVKPEMEQFVRLNGLMNVQFLPLQPKEQVPLFYGAADICFVPLKKGDYFTINIPSKIFEIMACARPIILGAEGQARAIMEASRGGVCITPEDVGGYVDAVLRIRELPAWAAEMGEQGRAFVLEHFTRQAKAAAYSCILEGINRP